ncbi:MAG TPA: CoA ester lyase [Burkholderiales bacterium]|nr:CoA ester lyase [Burkholderiales bacterium]
MKPIHTALFAPGSKERVMSKAFESGADAVIFDLEDSVAIAAKAQARTLVAQAIDRAAAAGGGPVVTVRVNAVATGHLDEDLAAIVHPGLSAIFLPKVEHVEEVQHAAAVLDALESARGLKQGSVEIIPMFESALGVYRCFDLLRASPRVATSCIGSAEDGDLQTDLGCAWSIEGPEILYAKSKVLLDTRAAGKHNPLDGVFGNLGDEDGFVRDCRLSARIGYVGRTVIHPKQIEPARKAYAVPAEDVAYYTRVVREFEGVEKTGAAAAITVDGKLVDYAMYSRAKRVLELAKLDG